MRRFTALIKKLTSFPPEVQESFFKIIKGLELQPGDWVPDDLPSGTLIFVEEGFLLLTSNSDNVWKCVNFYQEGTLTTIFSEDPSQMQEGRYRIRATEPTKIYYITSEDASQVAKVFPRFYGIRTLLGARSYYKNQKLKSIFKVQPAERIFHVDTYFRYLFRAPLEELADFLHLKTKDQKNTLAAVQKTRRSLNAQVFQNQN